MSTLYKNLTLAVFFLLILLSGLNEVKAQEGETIAQEKVLDGLVFKSVKMELWHGNVSQFELAKNDIEPSRHNQEPASDLGPKEYPEELTKVLDKLVHLQRP